MLCAGSEAKRFMNHAVAAGDAGERSAPSRGLYRPEEFRDNCGFGLIAHIEGEASHRLLQTAIESLTCMTHRGGIAADGRTGDGCGLLLQMPDAFMRAEAKAMLDVDLESITRSACSSLVVMRRRNKHPARPWRPR